MAPTAFPTARTAVVTGAGSPRGIGRVVARRLADDGWSVALLDLDGPGAEAAAGELRAAGAPAVGLGVDVTDPASVREAFTAIDGQLPPVVGLVNLAGIPSPTPLLDTTLEEWQRVLAVSATGSFLMTQAAGKRMVDLGVGRIVNTSSVTALDGGGTFSKTAYAAAKSAVLGLTRGTARELGPRGVTCNALLPGPIDTDIMGGRLSDERRERMAAPIPAGRVGQPGDVAAVVAFLLSEASAFVNGASLSVDGGLHMH